MEQMLSGIVLFFGIHLLPLSRRTRQRLIDLLGRWVYLGLYAAISLAGLWLIIRGYGQVPLRVLWTPPDFAHVLALALMPVAAMLVMAAYLPTRLKAILHHPMLIGVLMWAFVHLLANGDLASTLLFGSFLLYALVDMAFSRPRRTLIPEMPSRGLYDVLAMLLGLLLYGVLLYNHGRLFGVDVV